MKFKLFFIAMLLGVAVSAQNNTADAKIEAALCKDWKIVAYEMFGAVNQLESNEVNDHILLKSLNQVSPCLKIIILIKKIFVN